MLLALGVAASFWSFDQLDKAGQARTTSYTLIHLGEDVLADVINAETGQRGYLLTGNKEFLQPYVDVRGTIQGALSTLQRTSQLPAAQKHLSNLVPLVDARLTKLAELIVMREKQALTPAQMQVSLVEGKELMDAIRIEMHNFRQVEEDALAQREALVQSSQSRLFNLVVYVSLMVMVTVMAFGYWLLRQRRQQHEHELHLQTLQLLHDQQKTNRQLNAANITLQASEERLCVTLNSIGDGVITFDARGCVTLLNPVAEQLTGWSREKALGLPADSVFHIVNKASRQRATAPVQDALLHGTVQGLVNHTVLIALDGREHDISDSCAPIRDAEGVVMGAVLVFRSVTQEHVLQQTLRDSAALVQAILNTVVDGIATIHADGGTIESVNPAIATMFGYSNAELVGKDFGLLVPELAQKPDTDTALLAHYAASDASLAAGNMREVTGRRKDGSVFPLEVAVSELVLRGQRYFTGVLRDISTRQQVEEALRKAGDLENAIQLQIETEREALSSVLQVKNVELEAARAVAEKANLAKSDFLSSMSHELRTPLGAILGFAQLLESGAPQLTPTQQRSVEQILKAGWYLLELINEILDLALIESGKMSMSMESVMLSEVLSECAAMVEPQAQARGIVVTFVDLDQVYWVLADRTRVKQVLINLLSNAIKYNRLGGTVRVQCAMVSLTTLRINVQDTGEGLAADEVAQLFQSFNRLGQRTKVEEGTGIGLVVCKRLVELMHGEVGVESTVGVGSVFWFQLEVATTLVADDTPLDVPPDYLELPIERPYSLLYVEDNPANLMLVEDLMVRRPHIRLLTAKNGNMGVAIARASRPDVILMDINLPGISGIAAMRILAKDPSTAHIPVIALSANAVPRDISRGLDAGFFRYLTKPIKVQEFLSTLDLALAFACADSSPALTPTVSPEPLPP